MRLLRRPIATQNGPVEAKRKVLGLSVIARTKNQPLWLKRKAPRVMVLDPCSSVILESTAATLHPPAPPTEGGREAVEVENACYGSFVTIT
jgi:hypothetical protein